MTTESSLLPDLPDAARVWVHAAATPLDNAQDGIRDSLEAFVEEWTSHQTNVVGGVKILYNRFVILAGAQTDGASPSGCSIDNATKAVEAAARAEDVEWVPSLSILYRNEDGQISVASRSEFKSLIEEGSITTDTTVFDPSVTTLGEVRHGGFERSAGESWHGDAFSIPAPA